MAAKKMSRGMVRSDFELRVAKDLEKRKVRFKYEETILHYEVPSRVARYTPDFVLANGVVIEVKGRLTTADRKKMVLVKESNPTLDIRLLFMRAANPIRKGSDTTYGDWATKKNFKWCEGTVPSEWLINSNEVKNQ